MAQPSSSAQFRVELEKVLKGGMVPDKLAKRAGAGPKNQTRLSTAVKDKCSVLEGEMGRLTQDIDRMKKLKEKFVAVKKQLVSHVTFKV